MLALGWCFDSLKIIDKLLALTRWLEEQQIRCVWVTRGRETQCALAMAGVTTHAVEDFLPQWPEVAAAADLDNEALARCENYDRLAQRRIIALPVSEADYPRENARFCAGLWRILFSHYRPNLILNLNGQPCIARSMAELAERDGVPLLWWENGLVPETLVLDPKGVNYGAHLSGQGWNQLEPAAITAAQRDALHTWRETLIGSGTTLVEKGQPIGAEQLRRRLKIAPGARAVLVPLQVDSDTNIVLHSPLFKSMQTFVSAVQQAAASVPGTVLLIKDHPKRAPQGDPQIEQMLGSNARYVHDLHLPSLLAISDRVVCINTTVGIEALIQRLPVLAYGRSAYSEKGLTQDLYLEKDPAAALKHYLTAPAESIVPDQEALERFLVYLLRHHLWPVAGENRLGTRDAYLQQIQSLLATPAPQLCGGENRLDPLHGCLQPGVELVRRFQRLRQHSRGVMVVRGSTASGAARLVAERIQQGCPQLHVRGETSLWRRLNPFVQQPVDVLDLR